MRLHYNAQCVHGGLPTIGLRLMYAKQLYDEALQEITRLDGLQLEPQQRLVLNIHEVVVKLARDGRLYERAKVRLEELATHVAELGDENFMAKLRARRINIATRYFDHELATELTNSFFDDIPRTAITEAHWRIAHGMRAQRVYGPAAAILFYQTVLFNLAAADANHPCLTEMTVRRLATCVNDLGDKKGAVKVLRHWGLPAAIKPAEGEIALANLLVLLLL